MTPALQSTPAPVNLADIVIVGSGMAGLAVALNAVGKSVVVISKTEFGADGSSWLAQGGIAAALGFGDSPQQHAADTLAAGCGLCDPEVVGDVTREGPERIRELARIGAKLDRGPDGELALGREAAHGRPRIVHAAGDATGAELMRALRAAVLERDRVFIHQGVLAVDLIVDRRHVSGVVAVDREGRRIVYLAGAVVLATGGIGQVFPHTTNPAESTGDGLAMAARAGARLAGLEFVQFHPTALDDGSQTMALLTEALRGDGAILVDGHGERFMPAEHPQAELAPRDVVARAIWRRRLETGSVLLDARHLGERLATRFPTVTSLCRERGLDLAAQAVPVSPAAHYHMGGVVVDRWGRSSLPGLWACGEVSFTGLHGANRLASNSLLGALVYGRRVGRALAARPGILGGPRRFSTMLDRYSSQLAAGAWMDPVSDADLVGQLRELMWRFVGLERQESGLKRAQEGLTELAEAADRRPGELQNLLQVASLVTHAARLRTESRGAHYRCDFPRTDRHWRQDLFFEGARAVDPHPMADLGAVAG